MNPRTSPHDRDMLALADALRPSLLRLGRKLRRQSRALGLSPLDVSLLGGVKLTPGVGVCDLADREQIARPTMSVHIKRLEAEGYLARQAPASDDRRRVGLVVTPAGLAALDAVRRRRNDWLAERLDELPAESREALAAAAAALARLAGQRTGEPS